MRYFKFFLLILFIPGILHAQDDKKKAPAKIEIIKKDDYFNDKGKKRGKSKSSEQLNVLKVDAGLALLEGEATLFYERSLGSIVSDQVGVGTTFSGNIYNLLHSSVNLDDNNTYLSATKYGHSSPGVALHAEIRLYYKDEDDYPEGYYIALGTCFKTYNYQYSGNYSDAYNVGSAVMIPPVSTTSTYNSYQLIYGYQTQMGDLPVYFSYYFGLGIVQSKVQNVLVDRGANNDYKFTVQSTSYMNLDYSLGLSFGYRF